MYCVVMQGLTVLLLELSIGGIHLTVNKVHVESCINKLIKWLQSMKTVDAVSESAYNVVAKVLSKQSEEEAAARQMPQPQQQYNQHDFAIDPNLQPQYVPPLVSDSLNNVWPSSGTFTSGAYYPQANTGNFYPDDMSGTDYLNDPDAGLFEFGQPQMNLFYRNPYETTFDHWEWDPSAFEGQDQGPGPGSGPDQQQN